MRGAIIDGQPWFVAADACRILGVVNASNACRPLADDEKTTLHRLKVGMLPGAPVNAVSRPGLFKLISRSIKPEAKAFDRWVRHEVLPQIMDTGGYVTADANVEKVLEAAPGTDFGPSQETADFRHS